MFQDFWLCRTVRCFLPSPQNSAAPFRRSALARPQIPLNSDLQFSPCWDAAALSQLSLEADLMISQIVPEAGMWLALKFLRLPWSLQHNNSSSATEVELLLMLRAGWMPPELGERAAGLPDSCLLPPGCWQLRKERCWGDEQLLCACSWQNKKTAFPSRWHKFKKEKGAWGSMMSSIFFQLYFLHSLVFGAVGRVSGTFRCS